MSRCIVFVVLAAAVGCGPPAAPLVPAEGVIKINGAPAGNLLILFTPVPESGGKAVGSTAVSDAAGRYVLKSDDGRDGVVVGPHKVTVVDKNLESDDDASPGKRTARNRVPPLYAVPGTTPLDVVVEPGKKEYDLAVTGYGR